MKLDYRHLALALIVAFGLSGCQGLWNDLFGGGGSSSQRLLGIQPGELEECTPQRDQDIASKLANNVPCSADSQCPVGAFCTGNGVSGTCIRECGIGLPNCTGNRYCSCQGVCEEIGASDRDAGGGSVPATCERDPALLDEIRLKLRKCEWNSDCPIGSSCDSSTGRCAWSCKADSECTNPGELCDCLGNCVNPSADGGATFLRRAFSLVASPSSVNIVPGMTRPDGGPNALWTRAIHVTLQTQDPTMLVGSGSTRSISSDVGQSVTVRPGSNLQVACDNGGPPTYSTSGCDLSSAWSFTLEGATWKADQVVWIQPNPAPRPDAGVNSGDGWGIRLAGAFTNPSFLDVSVNLQSAAAEASWIYYPEFDPNEYGVYSGTIHLTTPLGNEGATTGGAQAGIDAQIQAVLGECTYRDGSIWVCLTFADPSSFISEKATMTIYAYEKGRRNSSEFGNDKRVLLDFGCPDNMRRTGGDTVQFVDGDLSGTSLRIRRPGGTLSGEFSIAPAVWSDEPVRLPWLQMNGSFLLSLDPTQKKCAASSDCRGGMVCDPSGLCVPNVTSNGCDRDHTPPWLPASLSHEGQGGPGGPLFSMMTLYDDDLLWDNLYRVTGDYGRGGGGYEPAGLKLPGSIFKHDLNESTIQKTYPRLIAPSALKAVLKEKPSVREGMARAFAGFIEGVASEWEDGSAELWSQAGGRIEQCVNKRQCIEAAIGPKPANTALIPCVKPDAISTGSNGLAPPMTGLWYNAADCSRYWANMRAISPAGASLPDTFDADGACGPTMLYLQTEATVAGQHATAAFRVYLCPGVENILGYVRREVASDLKEGALEYLCIRKEVSNSESPLEGNTVDTSKAVLANSGEYKCKDENPAAGTTNWYYRPSGIDLLTIQDAQESDSLKQGYGELLKKCMEDLAKNPKSTWLTYAIGESEVDKHAKRKTWLADNFVRNTCFSPSHFRSAFREVRRALDPADSYYQDGAAQTLYFGLLKQWLQLHAFIMTQGLEEHRAGRALDGSSALPSEPSGSGGTGGAGQTKHQEVLLVEILDTVEDGLGLILAEAAYKPNADLGGLEAVLRYPDYRAKGASGGNSVDHEQSTGFPVVLMETMTKYLRVVEEYLEQVTLEKYAEVVDGALPETLVAARRRAGFALRLAALLEQVAGRTMAVASGNQTACTKINQATVCQGRSCSRQDGAQGYCMGAEWGDKFRAAADDYLRVQRAVARLTLGSENPLGIDENDLPLFFSDLTGTNSRFFASSDYLLNNWAVSAVQSAQSTLEKARDSWVQRRNATIQDELNRNEEERRVEGIKSKYGAIIAANCGFKSTGPGAVATMDVLDKAKEYLGGAKVKKLCYIDDKLLKADGVSKLCEVKDTGASGGSGSEGVEACRRRRMTEASTGFLQQMGFYRKDFPNPQLKVGNGDDARELTWACRSFFRNPTNGHGEGVEVNVRVGSAPAPGMLPGHVYKTRDWDMTGGCDVTRPGDYTLIGSHEYPDSSGWYQQHRNVLRCLRKDATTAKCDRPTLEELDKSDGKKNCVCRQRGEVYRTSKYIGYPSSPDERWMIWTMQCEGDEGLECGRSASGVDVTWGVSTFGTCNSADSDKSVMVELANGNGAYRQCGSVDCQRKRPDSINDFGKDACGGQYPYGYGAWFWWPRNPDGSEDHSKENQAICLGDSYVTETCDWSLYEQAVAEQMKLMPLPYDLVEAIDQECQNAAEGAGDPGSKKVTALPMAAECYLGNLGASVVKGFGALEDVELAKLTWGSVLESYDIQGQVCSEMEKEKENIEARQTAFATEMRSWRSAKLQADILAAAASNAANSVASYGSSNIATVFQAQSMVLQTRMEDAQQEFDNFMRTQTLAQTVFQCFAEANKLQAQFDVQKGQIVRRCTDLAAAKQEFGRIMEETERAYSEGMAALKREQGRKTPTFAFHYWYEEKAERYLREFKWAKRLVYLAMRAVEYEFQQSLGLRKDVLGASHPDQLEGAIRRMQAEVATRAINRRRPQELSVVLSLRDDILGIIDRSQLDGSGERKSTPLRSFQERLWDPAYSVYDREGKWAGQGIPFAVTQQGATKDRCAERLWRVTATVQGDGLSDTQPGATVRLLKKNTFSSQWCEGLGNGSKMQVGQLQPSKHLFRDDPGPGVTGENDAFSTAAIYPWFNVRRSDFYKTSYQDGASEELAGRGLYGDYVLLFPAELLEGKDVPNPPNGKVLASFKAEQFPLHNVEDVLMRFDYLSVDNFAARGVKSGE